MAVLRDMIDGVIFDMNFTLIHWQVMKHQEKLAQHLGLDLARLKQTVKIFDYQFETGLDPRRRMHSVLATLGITAGRKLVDELISLEASETLKPILIYPEVHWMIESLLEDGLAVVICSNANYYGVEIARATGLADLMGGKHAFSYTVGMRKPDGAMYAAASEIVKIPPKRCLYVDDGGDRSLWGARQMGMLTVRPLHLDHEPDSHFQADWEIPAVSDVIELIKTAEPRARK